MPNSIAALPIAKNCRTSVEMIERFYAAHIKNTLDAAIINKRKPGTKRKTDDDPRPAPNAYRPGLGSPQEQLPAVSSEAFNGSPARPLGAAPAGVRPRIVGRSAVIGAWAGTFQSTRRTIVTRLPRQ
jgi:hypothetical protein